MIYIILDQEDGFIHMVTTDKAQAERELLELDDANLTLREYLDEGKR